MTESNETIAILGGTGDQGLGLALRFCRSGRRVLIGSRKAERALEAAEEVRKQVSGADVEGFGNEEATAEAEIVILSVPFEHYGEHGEGHQGVASRGTDRCFDDGAIGDGGGRWRRAHGRHLAGVGGGIGEVVGA